MIKSPDTFVSIDVETTGIDPQIYEIIEIGAVKVEKGEITGEFNELVKPVRLIPDFITHLTGITNNDVRNSRPIREVIPAFLDFVRGSVLLGHNVSFDVAFLRNAAGIGKVQTALDNIELARILLPHLPSYSLDSLIEFFALSPERRHRALDDAKITAYVFLKLLNILRLMPGDYVSEFLSISAKTGNILKLVFEAHLKERLSVSGHVKYNTGAYFPLKLRENDNIFGSVSPAGSAGEPGEARIDPEDAASILGEGGVLSSHHENYEIRMGQIALAREISRAFNESEILLAEAGTGIGKSLAYLIPSIFWANKSRERVIVSTNTKNLQEQLFRKDIPLLAKVLGFPFRAVILKGRGNYLCLNRWNRFLKTSDKYYSKEGRHLILPVASWLHETVTGDLSEMGFFPLLAETGLLEEINSESPLCIGTRCAYHDQCFVNRIRKAALESHIIIVNHSLVFSDMVSDGGVLGTYNRIIFDEAHNLEKVALRFLGVTLTFYRIRRILNRLYSASDGRYGILAQLAEWAEELVKAKPEFGDNRSIIVSATTFVQEALLSAEYLFERLHYTVREEAGKTKNTYGGKLRYYDNCPVFFVCREEIDTLEKTFTSLGVHLEQVILLISGISPSLLDKKDETAIELEELKAEILGILNDLAFLMEAAGHNVFWFEYDENGNPRSLAIMSAPLNVAEKLALGLYDHMETVVMTSATLTIAKTFTYFRSRLGVNLDSRERAREFIATSPFEYEKQALVLISSFMPSPKDDGFISAANDILSALALSSGRGMLALFTSHSHLQQAHHELRDRFTRSGTTLLTQGIDGPREMLLRRFKEETPSVLFGTDSFWEGIDVPGKALELVVITRLPFAVPTEPVVQALMEEVEKSGGDPFMDFSVPEAAIKLRQGAGRLIRHRNDKGAVIILDNRLHTTRYGLMFKQSLQGKMVTVHSLDMLLGTLVNWFETGEGAVQEAHKEKAQPTGGKRKRSGKTAGL